MHGSPAAQPLVVRCEHHAWSAARALAWGALVVFVIAGCAPLVLALLRLAGVAAPALSSNVAIAGLFAGFSVGLAGLARGAIGAVVRGPARVEGDAIIVEGGARRVEIGLGAIARVERASASRVCVSQSNGDR